MEQVGKAAEQSCLNEIFNLLSTTSGIDFAHYRHTTVLRRLTRRMSLVNIDNYQGYLSYLQADQSEIGKLSDDLLLFFTEFFRDPLVFEHLKKKVFPGFLESVQTPALIRIWIPGCSTGEEVYSLAISLYEFLEEHDSRLGFQIFGTDIAERHIVKARSAIYPKKITSSVGSTRLARYFEPVAGGYRVAKYIRESCIFAQQNIIQDPPFPNIDLISCRNVLIYFDYDLHKVVLPLFHFSLKKTGILLLGTSESLGRFTDLFSAVDKKVNIYNKCINNDKFIYDFPPVVQPLSNFQAVNNIPMTTTKNTTVSNLTAKIDKIMLESFTQAGLLVDSNMQILEFRGKTTRYLQPEAGPASLKLSKMAENSLMPDIYLAIQDAKKHKRRVDKNNITHIRENKEYLVNITVIPVNEPSDSEVRFLIVFEPVFNFGLLPLLPSDTAEDTEGQLTGNDELIRLRAELQGTKEHLQAIIEEKDEINQELWAANEEIQSTNEELQSVNEEMEAAKEELESSNEELLSLNEELQIKNIELGDANELNNNIIDSSWDGILVYDRDLVITRWNNALSLIFDLEAADCLGRNIFEILPFFADGGDDNRIVGALNGQTAIADNHEFELAQNKKQGVFNCRYSPLLDEHSQINNGLVIIHDITDRKKSEERYKRLFENMTSGFALHEIIVNELGKPVDYRLLEGNPAFEKLTGLKAKEMVGKTVLETLPNTEQYWIETYGKVALTGESISYENYAQELDKTFESFAFSPEKGQFAIIFNDISQRKSTEKSLIATRERLQLALEGSKGGIWDWNIKDESVFFDSNYFRFSGYEVDEFPHSYEEWRKRVHPDDIKQCDTAIEECLVAGKQDYSQEFRFKAKDGHWIWMLGQGKIVEYDDNHNPLRFIGTQTDISMTKEIEDNLLQSEKRFRDLFDNMKNCVAIYQAIDDGQDFSFVDFNHAAEKLENLSREEVVGLPVTKVFPGIVEFGILDVFKRVWQTGIPEEFPISFYEDAAQAFWRENYIFKAPSGEIVAVYDDVTEKTKAEQVLQKSQERFEILFEHNPAAIWLEDFAEVYRKFDELRSQGVTDFDRYLTDNPQVIAECIALVNVLDINQATVDLHHANSKKELLTNIEHILIEESFTAIKKELLALWNGETRIEVESVIQTFDHIEKAVTIICNVIPGNHDGLSLILVSVHDISEMRRAEKELFRVQQIQSIATLAGGIAHDFNNILTGIFGNLSIAKDQIPKSHKARKFLDAAESSINRATGLTSQLLTFTKGGAPKKEKIAITNLLDAVISFDLSGSNIKPVIVAEEDLWRVEVDQSQIQQVISNLTINAKQAMTDGGVLSVSLENYLITKPSSLGLSPGKYVKIMVKDNGPGIADSSIKRIFDPYFSTKEKGCGLGLTTSFSILKRHGGYLGVSSTLGVGTVFTLYLPASKNITENVGKALPERTEGATKRASILVMDDEEMLRILLTAMLSGLDHQVDSVAEGQAAIDAYQQAYESKSPYDLLIMDLTIPGGLGGKDAIAKILAMHPEARAIVSSGYADDPIMANFADYGFVGRIEKPYTLAQLSQVLLEVL